MEPRNVLSRSDPRPALRGFLFQNVVIGGLFGFRPAHRQVLITASDYLYAPKLGVFTSSPSINSANQFFEMASCAKYCCMSRALCVVNCHIQIPTRTRIRQLFAGHQKVGWFNSTVARFANPRPSHSRTLKLWRPYFNLVLLHHKGFGVLGASMQNLSKQSPAFVTGMQKPTIAFAMNLCSGTVHSTFDNAPTRR